MADIELKVDGMIHSGWLEMHVTRGIDRFSGAFQLKMTERHFGQPEKESIQTGSPCELLLDGTTIITGYVDTTEYVIDTERHEINVIGRDKAGDLVDCSAILPSATRFGDVKGQSLPKLAKLLCDPFSIKVIDTVGLTDPVENIHITPGDTVFDVLTEAARKVGVFIMSDGLGQIVISRAGTEVNPTPLILGGNILSADYKKNNVERFSTYFSLSQTPANDFWNGEQATSQESKALDKYIGRYRPKVAVVDHVGDRKTLSDQVQWRRNRCRGRSRTLRVKVAGWSSDGRLWQPNELVKTEISGWGLNMYLLVVSVKQSISIGDGTITELELVPPAAYELFPSSDDDESQGWG